MTHQINITIENDMMEHIVKEAGKRMTASGMRCPLSNIVSEIFVPAADSYFNGDSRPTMVSPPDNETISQDDSQDDSQNVTEHVPPGINVNDPDADPYNFNDIDF